MVSNRDRINNCSIYNDFIKQFNTGDGVGGNQDKYGYSNQKLESVW